MTENDADENIDDETDDDSFEPDPERVAFLREIAEDVRGDTSQSEQLAAILYRMSDLYDENEDTSPEDIYRNVKTILQIKERGTLARD